MGMTTGFTEDSTVKVNATRDLLFPPVSAAVSDAQSLALFLAKPQRLTNLSWSASSVANTILTSGSILNTLRLNTYWSSKFAGYRYFRGTAVIRVELNAQPFHAGRLLLHFLPQYEARVLTNGTYTQHNKCLCAKTQQNSVELDCRDSSAVMRIPYISPFSHADLLAGNPITDWGSYFLTVLSPLATGTGQDTAEISLFLSFEDVEFIAPIAQSGRKRDGKKAMVAERENLAYTGKISGGLEKLGTRVDWLKEWIPGKVVDTGKSVLNGVAGILDVFGWSKPIFAKVNEVFLNAPLRLITNYNGANHSDVLALDAINAVDPIECPGGIEQDEMHFSHLKLIPAFVENFGWDTTTATGTMIYSKIVQPRQMVQLVSQVITDVNTICGFAPPFSFLSRYFEYYRGSINLTLKFVKTQFHTGRLLVVYVPQSTSPTLDQTQNALREIIDIKDSNEITLNLPYLYNSSYVRTGYGSPAVESPYQIRIYVLNPLVATDNVSSAIDVLVYASAGEDFELAKPVAGDDYKVIAQMNIVEPVLTRKRIGGYPATPLSNTPIKTCVGEVFTSIKQLINMSRPVAHNLTGQASRPATGLTSVSFWPWVFGVPSGITAPSSGGNFVGIPALASDYLSEFATGFAYYRGGLRYTINSTGTTSQQTQVSITPRTLGQPIEQTLSSSNTYNYYGTITAAVSPANITNSFRNCAFRTSALGPNLDITVPYYGNTPFRFTHLNTALDKNIPTSADTAAETLIITSTANPLGSGLLRAAADDFQFSYFVGFIGFFIST